MNYQWQVDFGPNQKRETLHKFITFFLEAMVREEIQPPATASRKQP